MISTSGSCFLGRGLILRYRISFFRCNSFSFIAFIGDSVTTNNAVWQSEYGPY
jgi:hypothetical protein